MVLLVVLLVRMVPLVLEHLVQQFATKGMEHLWQMVGVNGLCVCDDWKEQMMK